MERLLKVNEVATLLATTPRSLYQKVYHGKVPFVKLGRSLRFKLSDLEKWIDAGTRPARPGP